MSEVVLYVLKRELLDCCTLSRDHSPNKIHQTPLIQTECCRRKHQIIVFYVEDVRYLKSHSLHYKIACFADILVDVGVRMIC